MLALTIFLGLTAGAFAGSSSSSSASSYSSASSSSYVPPAPITDGPCPYVVGETPDFSLMVGPWYEVQRSANNFDYSDKCHRFVWNEPMNNSSKLVYNAVSLLAPITSETISVAVPNYEGMGVTYHIPTVGNVFKQRVFLDLNYDDHVILWTCEQMGNQHRETSWVHSRKPTTGPRMEAIKRDAFTRHNLTIPQMVYHDTSDCDMYYASYDKCQ